MFMWCQASGDVNKLRLLLAESNVSQCVRGEGWTQILVVRLAWCHRVFVWERELQAEGVLLWDDGALIKEHVNINTATGERHTQINIKHGQYWHYECFKIPSLLPYFCKTARLGMRIISHCMNRLILLCTFQYVSLQAVTIETETVQQTLLI